jgi:transcriptional regulator with AAA-type ATPase domain
MDTDLTTSPLEEPRRVDSSSKSWCINWIHPSAISAPTLLSEVAFKPHVIGRSAGVDVELSTPGVSRAHAELRLEGKNVLLRDLGSRNGVFVNGRREAKHLLCGGDLIRVGDCLGVVEELGPSDTADGSGLEGVPGFYVSGPLRAALAPAERLARTDLPIVIQGETGTGKEGTARAIHQWSGRGGPFVALNCAALPQSLAEAELFGYRRGAFSGAEQSSLGLMRAAAGGTLFLDEIIELPLTVQAKLLRAIELLEVQPLGEHRSVKVDVRVLSASQLPLADAVSSGRFRADLAARLSGFTVELPPLRQRRAELPQLFLFLLSQAAGARAVPVEARLIERLCLHAWPGNVRELAMLVRRLLGLHGHEPQLLLAHAQALLPNPGAAVSNDSDAVEIFAAQELQTREERDLAALLRGLRQHGGNLAKAASAAAISRQRAYRLLQACPGFVLAEYRDSRRVDDGTT